MEMKTKTVTVEKEEAQSGSKWLPSRTFLRPTNLSTVNYTPSVVIFYFFIVDPCNGLMERRLQSALSFWLALPFPTVFFVLSLRLEFLIGWIPLLHPRPQLVLKTISSARSNNLTK